MKTIPPTDPDRYEAWKKAYVAREKTLRPWRIAGIVLLLLCAGALAGLSLVLLARWP